MSNSSAVLTTFLSANLVRIFVSGSAIQVQPAKIRRNFVSTVHTMRAPQWSAEKCGVGSQSRRTDGNREKSACLRIGTPQQSAPPTGETAGTVGGIHLAEHSGESAAHTDSKTRRSSPPETSARELSFPASAVRRIAPSELRWGETVSQGDSSASKLAPLEIQDKIGAVTVGANIAQDAPALDPKPFRNIAAILAAILAAAVPRKPPTEKPGYSIATRTDNVGGKVNRSPIGRQDCRTV